jgi:hypothetical protein
MRVITNENTIQRNRQFAQYSFFISIGILVASLFFGGGIVRSNPDAAFFINCILPFFMLALILFAVRLSNQWVREPVPWKAIQESLRGYSNDATLYHFIFPVRHVLVSSTGVYVLVPYFQDRPIFVKDDRWRMPGGLGAAIMTFMRQERITNPTLEAKLEAETLERYLSRNFDGIAIEVQPIIIFTSPRAQVVITGENSVPIVFTTTPKKKAEKLVKEDDEDNEKTKKSSKAKPIEEDEEAPEEVGEEDSSEEEVEEEEEVIAERLSLKEYLRQQKNSGRVGLTKEQINTIEEKLIYTYE